MKKLTKYQLNKISKNLDFFFNLAEKEDIKSGKLWYKDAYNICIDISQKYNTTTFKAAGVISALSPRNRWSKNIEDAYTVFQAIKEGKQPEDIKVSTFHVNKFKAWAIAEGKIQITDKSLKTFNFVNNIAYLSEDHLTVDIWHLRACLKEFKSIKSASIGRIAYKQIKDLSIKKALNAGLTSYQYQAIIWITTQKYFNNLTK